MCRDEIFFKCGISSLISRTIFVSKMIERKIDKSFLIRICEPYIHESCSRLKIIGFLLGECYEMDRVISEKIMDCKSTDDMSRCIICEPLTNLWSIEGYHAIIVADIGRLIPVFHFGRTKTMTKLLRRDCLYGSAWCEEFFSSAARSIIPRSEIGWCRKFLEWFLRNFTLSWRFFVRIKEFRISRLFEMIRKPESSPRGRYARTPIRDPHDESMLESCSFFELFDIRLVGDSFSFYHPKPVSENLLFPRILWWMIDIESYKSARFEIHSIRRWSGTMVIEIFGILVFGEGVHNMMVSENVGKGKKWLDDFFWKCHFFLPIFLSTHSILCRILLSFFLTRPFPFSKDDFPKRSRYDVEFIVICSFFADDTIGRSDPPYCLGILLKIRLGVDIESLFEDLWKRGINMP